jgi:hypothetical protein
MSDLEIIEYSVQVVLAKCRKANPHHLKIPPSGDMVMKWFADALNEAKALTGEKE